MRLTAQRHKPRFIEQRHRRSNFDPFARGGVAALHQVDVGGTKGSSAEITFSGEVANNGNSAFTGAVNIEALINGISVRSGASAIVNPAPGGGISIFTIRVIVFETDPAGDFHGQVVLINVANGLIIDTINSLVLGFVESVSDPVLSGTFTTVVNV